MRRRIPADLGHVAAFVAAASLALAVAACGGGATASPSPLSSPASAAPSEAPPAGGTDVTIEGFAFNPPDLTVKVGATVTWSNRDAAPHTVKWDDGTPGSGQLTSGGAPYTRTFDTAGTFSYACGIHPNMKGTITVEP
jgi:plastocyanin